MKLVILSLFVATSFADLRSYVPPHFGGGARTALGGASGARFSGPPAKGNGLAGHRFSAGQHLGFGVQQPHDRFSSGELQRGFGGVSCGEGQVLTFDGHCADADVSKSIYLYSSPKFRARPRSGPAYRPKPKLNYNVVFVRAPEEEEEEPIIVPPPQQKTIVYVLRKDSGSGEQEVIELPGGPSLQPEVYYVNYRDGDNPELSLGLNLEGALSKAVREEAKTIFTDDAASGEHGFGGDSRFAGHGGFQGDHSRYEGDHSRFEGPQEFHGEGPSHSSGEFEVQRQHVPHGFPQQPSSGYGLPSRK